MSKLYSIERGSKGFIAREILGGFKELYFRRNH